MPLIDVQRALARIISDDAAWHCFHHDPEEFQRREHLSSDEFKNLATMDIRGLELYRTRLHARHLHRGNDNFKIRLQEILKYIKSVIQSAGDI